MKNSKRKKISLMMHLRRKKKVPFIKLLLVQTRVHWRMKLIWGRIK